jgi:hypothetical protein
MDFWFLLGWVGGSGSEVAGMLSWHWGWSIRFSGSHEEGIIWLVGFGQK